MMININVKRMFAGFLTVGMLLGSVPAYAESETGNDVSMMPGGSGMENTTEGFAGRGNGPGNGGHGPMGQGNGNMGGQDEVMALFDQDQAAYTFESWDAQEDADTQNSLVQAMIDEGLQANMIRFETGTVLDGGSGMEHMASFNYAYKISALRDWLFEQSR